MDHIRNKVDNRSVYQDKPRRIRKNKNNIYKLSKEKMNNTNET